jgi:mannose-1-phosphate guanylyltransferase
VKAIVLVGGEGTRLRPLTYDRPKQMLPVVGRPMIEWVIEHLAAHGVDVVVLSLGYLPDAFMAAYPDGQVAGARLIYAVEPEPYDTAGAVRFAMEQVGVDDTFVVLNGDVLSDLDLTALVAFHKERGAAATVHLHPVEDPSRFGVVVTDAEGRVEAFIEKPPPGEAPTNLINAGTYVMEPGALGGVPLGRRVSIERETFPALAKEGVLFALAEDSYWLDTGTPAAYVQANSDVLSGRRAGAVPPSGAEVAPGVWAEEQAAPHGACTGSFLGAGSVVAGGAEVSGTVLGRRCLVEEGAVVTDSVCFDDVRVGRRAVVTNSIVGQGSRVGDHCGLRGLSVLGTGVALPEGTTLDGQRIPEPSARQR